jgi:sortase A
VTARIVCLIAITVAMLTGCAAPGPGSADAPAGTEERTSSPSQSSRTPSASQTPSATPSEAPSASATPERQGPRPTDGRPREARLSIARIGLSELVVVPYTGMTDDAPGTAIQDEGRAASPHGPRGGVGPGGIGNYQVTAHRLSSTQAFLDLPALRVGDEVVVESAGRRLVYRITGTRETSFRSAESLRAQRAAVPGRPGVRPTRAMITLSTCATPEDRAEGNYWSDEFGNPEHRIDKIGVLVANRPV